MDIIDIARECAESLSARARLGLPAENASVCLVVPKGWRPPPGFPRGTMVQVRPDGARVCYFPALRLSAWLVAFMDARIGDGATGTSEGTAGDPGAERATPGLGAAECALPRRDRQSFGKTDPITSAATATEERRPRSAVRSRMRRPGPN